MRSLDYFKGATDIAIGLLLEEEIFIDEEKDMQYSVSERGVHGWKISFDWIIGFNTPKKSICENPADSTQPVRDTQELYFSYDVKNSKIIKEITAQLEIIQNVKIGDVEDDNSDERYELRREAVDIS